MTTAASDVIVSSRSLVSKSLSTVSMSLAIPSMGGNTATRRTHRVEKCNVAGPSLIKRVSKAAVPSGTAVLAVVASAIPSSTCNWASDRESPSTCSTFFFSPSTMDLTPLRSAERRGLEYLSKVGVEGGPENVAPEASGADVAGCCEDAGAGPGAAAGEVTQPAGTGGGEGAGAGAAEAAGTEGGMVAPLLAKGSKVMPPPGVLMLFCMFSIIGRSICPSGVENTLSGRPTMC
mmetsp:Transcript_21548/g.28284  ORF Transcript_21548/g.28284 Transcript_21548/m.28284 type:complete len:233 (+) Transcript_21548:904-1602(+)